MLEKFSGNTVAIIIFVVAVVVVIMGLVNSRKNKAMSDSDSPITEPERRDAKRFAKLLANEIKIYNEQAIQAGKASNNVYLKVKTDIDRSQEMYNKRVSVKIQQECDYFKEALVEILCDGDARLLGK
jgi:hypothetical protein